MVIISWECFCGHKGGFSAQIEVEENSILIRPVCLACGHEGVVHLETYFQVRDDVTLPVGTIVTEGAK